MIRNIIIFLSVGAGLTACSSLLYTFDSQTNIDESYGTSIEMDSLVAPFRRDMLREFGQVIGEASTDLVTGRPNSTLGFWLCDELIKHAKDSVLFKNEPVVAFINIGGLRADIPKGPITIGDVYKVMPFDNRMVFVKLALDKLPQMEAYLKEKGGEPIGGFKLERGKLTFPDSLAESKKYFWVITSDFLANGGDNMLFFANPLERYDTNILFRDFIIEAVKKEKIITFSPQERLTW